MAAETFAIATLVHCAVLVVSNAIILRQASAIDRLQRLLAIEQASRVNS